MWIRANEQNNPISKLFAGRISSLLHNEITVERPETQCIFEAISNRDHFTRIHETLIVDTALNNV